MRAVSLTFLLRVLLLNPLILAGIFVLVVPFVVWCTHRFLAGGAGIGHERRVPLASGARGRQPGLPLTPEQSLAPGSLVPVSMDHLRELPVPRIRHDASFYFPRGSARGAR
jgi:hypothetical protein